MQIVVFIIGHPRSGKDSLADFLRAALPREWAFVSTSSIEPIRRMAEAAGVVDPTKSDRYRSFLSEVGEVAERLLSLRTAHVVETIVHARSIYLASCASEGPIHLMAAVQVREQYVIDSITAAMLMLYPLTRLVTVRARSSTRGYPVVSNPSDAAVDDVRSDYVVQNDGTLDDLEERIHELVAVILGSTGGAE